MLLKNLTIAEAFSLLSLASASSSEISFVKMISFVKLQKNTLVLPNSGKSIKNG
jgi:hypothetical protein